LWNTKEQLKHVQELFPCSIRHHGRFCKFANNDEFKDGISSLSGSFHEAAGKLEEAWVILIACYEQAEEGAEINPSTFEGVHELLREIFGKGEDVSGEVELQLLVSVLVLPRKSVKWGWEGEASTKGTGKEDSVVLKRKKM
jgi:hypothetical protein